MRIRNICLILCSILYTYFNPIVDSQEIENKNNITEVIEIDNLEDFNLDDLELIDEIDENNEEFSTLTDTDIVIISNIILRIDNNQYNNPGANSSTPSNNITKPELAMKKVTFRRGDTMSMSDLKQTLLLSLQNIKQSPYFYASENTFDYLSLDDIDEMGNHKITIFINVKQGFLFNFTGGNSFAGLGFRYPIGLRTFYYIGANRLEADIVYEGINIKAKEHSYSRVFLDIGNKTFLYWLWPTLDDSLKWNSLLYGTIPHIGISITPFRLSSAVGIFGISTLDYKKNNMTSIYHVGLPESNQGSFYTLDIRNTFEIKQNFVATEIYDHYIEMKLPYMIGSVIHSHRNDFPVGHVYDLLAGTVETQIGFKAGIDQAIRIKAGVASNLISDKNPFIAKVNLNSHFYNTIFMNLYQRGAYSEKVSIGEKGFMGSIEYRLALFKVGIFALENFAFYDIGSAANSITLIQDNIRHSVGSGLIFHFFSPVNIMAKTSFAFGGILLNQPDGPPISFSIEIISRK